MADVVTAKEALTAAGRLKAIAQAAKYDTYWSEKVDDGFHREMLELERLSAKMIADAELCPKAGDAA